jgi:hypothetical protein
MTALTIVACMTLPPAATGQTTAGPRLMVVWGAGSLGRKVEPALDRMRDVRATSVRLGLPWLKASFDAQGRPVDDPPDGYAYPIEAAVIRPEGYSLFVPETERALVASLRRKQALLSESEADLRGPVETLRLSGRTVRVAGVVSDEATHGHEILLSAPVPRPWPGTIRTVLVRSDRSVARTAIRRTVRRALGDGPFRMRSQEQTRLLRYAVSVRPLIAFKTNFGEFAARPSKEGPLDLAPGWTNKHITTDGVPILGDVTCHRKLFPQLRGALRELKRKGKSHAIRPDEYAGCFNPRFVAASPGIRISRHTWGIAVDLNTSNNAYGAEPNQPPALVNVMRDWGFLWGGVWMTPDGMHFEWKWWP